MALSSEDYKKIVEYHRRMAIKEARATTLERMFTHKDYFGVETASPLQRAICRVADGVDLGDLAEHEDVIEYIGGVSHLSGRRPEELAVFSGIRTGKSLFAACLAVHATQSCDVGHMGSGEMPRVSVVSLTRDLAHVILKHIVGNCMSARLLRPLVIGDPTADTIILRHPTGMPVEIKVTAGSRAGGSLVARWSAGCIFDEAPRMVGGEDGVVNWDDLHDAVKGRLVPGAQIISVGSPWAPRGPAWRIVQEHWKKPSAAMVCIKAPAPALNPVWWTKERCDRLRETDPDVYRTDVQAEFLEPSEAMFSSAEIEASMRPSPLHLPHNPNATYVAAMDPATRSNDWTLVVATKLPDGRKAIATHRRWSGSKAAPLSPDAVMAEVAAVLAGYGTTLVYTDQYSGDALRDIGRHHGLVVVVEEWTARKKVELYSLVKTEMSVGQIELPADPLIMSDIMSVRKAVTNNGISIKLPMSADGRHADYAPSIVMALSKFIDKPKNQAPTPGTVERAEWEAKRMEEADDEAFMNSKSRPWWA